MRLSGYGNVPEHLEVRKFDLFRTMEFRPERDGADTGMQPIYGGYIPKAEPMPMGNPYNMYPNQQQVAFNLSDLNPFKNVMGTQEDNSVKFGDKMIDKNLYEQLKNNPERMQEYIRQQYLEEGGQKYF